MQGSANIIKTAVSNFVRIDILVNCAGNMVRAPINEMTEDQWDSIINVHLKGHFSCCKAAAMEMIKQKSGRIINFSSLAADGIINHIGYSSDKAKKCAIIGQSNFMFSPFLTREAAPFPAVPSRPPRHLAFYLTSIYRSSEAWLPITIPLRWVKPIQLC